MGVVVVDIVDLSTWHVGTVGDDGHRSRQPGRGALHQPRLAGKVGPDRCGLRHVATAYDGQPTAGLWCGHGHTSRTPWRGPRRRGRAVGGADRAHRTTAGPRAHRRAGPARL